MAGFNINQFVSQGLTRGGARPSQFNIELTPPPGIAASNISRRISFSATAASLPASIIPEVEVPYFGRKIKLNGDRVYDNWTITLQNDEDFQVRSVFEAWHAGINTPVSNRLNVNAFGSLVGYKVDAVVNQFSKAGPGDEAGVIRSYKFVGIWPITVDAIPLDWAQTNTIETFNVTLAVDWVEPLEQGLGIPYSPVLSDDGIGGVL